MRAGAIVERDDRHVRVRDNVLEPEERAQRRRAIQIARQAARARIGVEVQQHGPGLDRLRRHRRYIDLDGLRVGELALGVTHAQGKQMPAQSEPVSRQRGGGGAGEGRGAPVKRPFVRRDLRAHIAVAAHANSSTGWPWVTLRGAATTIVAIGRV